MEIQRYQWSTQDPQCWDKNLEVSYLFRHKLRYHILQIEIQIIWKVRHVWKRFDQLLWKSRLALKNKDNIENCRNLVFLNWTFLKNIPKKKLECNLHYIMTTYDYSTMFLVLFIIRAALFLYLSVIRQALPYYPVWWSQKFRRLFKNNLFIYDLTISLLKSLFDYTNQLKIAFETSGFRRLNK